MILIRDNVEMWIRHVVFCVVYLIIYIQQNLGMLVVEQKSDNNGRMYIYTNSNVSLNLHSVNE